MASFNVYHQYHDGRGSCLEPVNKFCAGERGGCGERVSEGRGRGSAGRRASVPCGGSSAWPARTYIDVTLETSHSFRGWLKEDA